MGQTKTFYLLEPFHTIPVEENNAWLGRIVKDFRNPRAGYTPDDPSSAIASLDDDPNFSNVGAIIQSSSSKNFRIALQDMLGLSGHHSNTLEPTFHTRKVRRIRLHNDDGCLDKILDVEETRSKVLGKGWLGIQRPVYFIVGLLITDKVNYVTKGAEKKQLSVKVSPSQAIAAALAGGAAPAALPGADAVTFSGSARNSSSTEVKLTATGMRIFAVEYRVLRKTFFSSDEVEMKRHNEAGPRTFAAGDDDQKAMAAQPGNAVKVDDGLKITLAPDPLSELEDTEERSFVIEKDLEEDKRDDKGKVTGAQAPRYTGDSRGPGDRLPEPGPV
jgi:hypothetical protein